MEQFGKIVMHMLIGELAAYLVYMHARLLHCHITWLTK